MQLTASNAAQLNGKTPLGAITGETPDISQYLDFGWYDWVWYKENAGLDVPKIGKFLGIANSVSNLMTYHILPKSGIPITAGTVQRGTHLEQQTDAVKQRMKEFNERIADKFKEGRIATEGDKPSLQEWQIFWKKMMTLLWSSIVCLTMTMLQKQMMSLILILLTTI